jgi:isoprenylcysteine carboxyl methyltransferase (ICMT) family protein YpbQ
MMLVLSQMIIRYTDNNLLGRLWFARCLIEGDAALLSFSLAPLLENPNFSAQDL